MNDAFGVQIMNCLHKLESQRHRSLLNEWPMAINMAVNASVCTVLKAYAYRTLQVKDIVCTDDAAVIQGADQIKLTMCEAANLRFVAPIAAFQSYNFTALAPPGSVNDCSGSSA
mmetsp:Transcript_13200/g.23349  ORF Transcript_13200/g.23349 Transcript_13200/m.23349 type:complete len:114 (+) Transcript_13200:909-1250(+)